MEERGWACVAARAGEGEWRRQKMVLWRDMQGVARDEAVCQDVGGRAWCVLLGKEACEQTD